MKGVKLLSLMTIKLKGQRDKEEIVLSSDSNRK